MPHDLDLAALQERIRVLSARQQTLLAELTVLTRTVGAEKTTANVAAYEAAHAELQDVARELLGCLQKLRVTLREG